MPDRLEEVGSTTYNLASLSASNDCEADLLRGTMPHLCTVSSLGFSMYYHFPGSRVTTELRPSSTMIEILVAHKSGNEKF